MPRRLPDATALAVVGAGVLLAAATRMPAMPPFLPIGDYPEYNAATPVAEIVLAPVMHAPWFGRVPVLLAMALAAAVLACLWAVARRLGAAAGSAAAIVLAAAARPEFSAGAAPTAAVALSWVAIAAAAASSSWRTAAMAAVAAATAALMWPPIVVVLPLVVSAASAAGQWRALTLAVIAIPAGLVAGAAAWASRAGALAGEPVGIGDVLAVARLAPAGDVPYAWPPLTAMLLPLALAVAGALVLCQRPARRTAWVAGLAGTLAVAVVLPAWRLEFERALAWTAWPLAAVGLTWLVDRASLPRRRVVLAVIALVLVGSGLLGRIRLTELVEPRAFAAALQDALATTGAAPVVVAEDPRIDTALVSWAGARLRRVRPIPELVEAAAAGGSGVLAGPSARAALELWGLRFTAGPSVGTSVPFGFSTVTGGFHCLEIGGRWSELPGLDYTGRLGVHLPPGDGHLEVAVVGAAPLDVRVTTATGRPRGSVTTTTLPDLAEVPPVLWPGDGRLPGDGTAIAQARIDAVADAVMDLAIALGARAPLVGARMVDGAMATVCAAPLSRPDPLEQLGEGERWRLPLDDEAYAGAGWRPLDRGRTSDARRTDGRGVFLVPSTGARRVAIAVDASLDAPPDSTPATLTIAVNGVTLATRPIGAAPATIEVTAPPTMWVDGTNEVALALDSAPGAAADRPPLVVRGVRLARNSGLGARISSPGSNDAMSNEGAYAATRRKAEAPRRAALPG